MLSWSQTPFPSITSLCILSLEHILAPGLAAALPGQKHVLTCIDSENLSAEHEGWNSM